MLGDPHKDPAAKRSPQCIPVYRVKPESQGIALPAERKRSRSTRPDVVGETPSCRGIRKELSVKRSSMHTCDRRRAVSGPVTTKPVNMTLRGERKTSLCQGSHVRPSNNDAGHQDLRGGCQNPQCQGSRVRPSNNEAGHRDLAQKGSNPPVLRDHPSDPASCEVRGT